MTARIPMSITQDEFNEAMKPLFDRLGTSAMEVVGDISIVSSPTGASSNYEIRYTVVAQPPNEVSEFPPGILADGHPQDDEFTLWTHQINVAVINA